MRKSLDLSIVTVNKDNPEGLKKTLESVSALRSYYPDFEYVVVDAGTCESCLNLIEASIENIDTAVVGKDKGLADAFNLGVTNSAGKYVFFLNSGDLLIGGEVVKALNDNLGSFIISCKVLFDGKRIGVEASNKMQKLRNYLPHQGMLISRMSFDKYGLYDESFSLGMDYEWSLRLGQDDWEGIAFSNFIVSEMEPGGISVSNPFRTYMAYHQARMKNKSLSPVLSILISYFFLSKHSVSKFLKSLYD